MKRLCRSFSVPLIFCHKAFLYYIKLITFEIQLTVAENRAIAEECILFQYFDHHDIWHFISSLASFFSLIAIAVLDDDIAISHLNGRSISTF